MRDAWGEESHCSELLLLELDTYTDRQSEQSVSKSDTAALGNWWEVGLGK